MFKSWECLFVSACMCIFWNLEDELKTKLDMFYVEWSHWLLAVIGIQFDRTTIVKIHLFAHCTTMVLWCCSPFIIIPISTSRRWDTTTVKRLDGSVLSYYIIEPWDFVLNCKEHRPSSKIIMRTKRLVFFILYFTFPVALPDYYQIVPVSLLNIFVHCLCVLSSILRHVTCFCIGFRYCVLSIALWVFLYVKF